jgi:O-methyltransferase involved in polyketide biosynthesis
MSRWNSISITAHYTAQVWARNHLSEACLFDTRRGRILYALVHPLFAASSRLGVTAPHEFCLQRHHLIDALLQQSPPDQLVELACGLSPRCLAFSRTTGLPCIDVDLPDLLRLKADLVGCASPPSYHQVALDLIATEDYAAILAPLLRTGTRTVVIAEGFLAYFPLSTQQRFFDRVAALLAACGGGVFLTDVHHQEDVDRLGALGTIFRTGLGLLSRTVQHPGIPNFEEGCRMLRRSGFSAVSVHRPADWSGVLDAPAGGRDSGLRVYEARLDAPRDILSAAAPSSG